MERFNSSMADNHDSSRGSAGNIDRGALLPKYSPVATDDSSTPTIHRVSDPVNLWRPFTLRPPTLLLFLLLTIVIIAIIEALNYFSNRNGALTFADPQGKFSATQTFCHRYLPQLIVVLYGIGWAAVDLDVKRLEPYFQLSKPGGASASDSILLHYPFNFLPVAPFAAAKRKHWNVFAAGMALVLIFSVITPLQSSLLTRELVARAYPMKFGPVAKLLSYSRQRKELDSGFFYYSYGVTWLGLKLAGCMTSEYISIPFGPLNYTYNGTEQGNESWTAVTRVYQTYIDCVPATIIEPGENDGGVYNFTTDGCSCSFNPLADQNATRNLLYIGYGHNDTGQLGLREPECTVKNIFLGVWGRSRLPSTRSADIDVVGIFCRTRYSYADVDITAETTTWEITGPSLIGEPKPLTPEDEIIDIDIFEKFLGTGSTSFYGDAEHFPSLAPTTRVQYEDWDLWSPSYLVGYAIGLENKTFDDFRDPKIFGDAMNKTHKLLFNFAVLALFREEYQPQTVNGTRIIRKDGVVVVSVFAHLLAGFLSAVAVCVASVFFLSYNRPNNLRSDPDSLATTMSLVAQSTQLLKDFEGADNCPDIRRCIKRRRRYKLWGAEDGHRLDIVDGSDVGPSGGSHESSTKPHDGRGVRPWELSAGMGVFVTIFSAGLLVFFAFLFWSNKKNSGLPTLSDRQWVVQLIFSFMPTAIATLIEPFWVVVTRYLALYQPWTELRRGHSSSAASLGLKYTNLPPVLIAPRALAGSHYVLSLASLVVLASNVLAVALGGLFEGVTRQVSSTAIFEFPLSPYIDTQAQTKGVSLFSSAFAGTFAKDSEEDWLIALSNGSGTSLPPWTAPGFYFLPFEWSKAAGNESGDRSANTWGFGTNLTCKLLAGDVYGQQSWVGLSDDPVPSPAVALNVTIPMANGREVRCNNSLVRFTLQSPVTGRFAGEYIYGLGATDKEDQEAEEFCHTFLVVGWSRGSASVERGICTIDTSTYENTTILCTPQISSAKFKVIVDNIGLVQRFTRFTPFSYDDSSLFNYSTTIASFKAQLNTHLRINPLSGTDSGGMHSDGGPGSLPRSLPHLFIETIRGNLETLCNPLTPPPSFEIAQREFQALYSWFAPIVIGQNSERIFRPTTKDGGRKPQVSGEVISIQDRMSMDAVMFYIAISLLCFSTLASIAIFNARPRRFLPRLPNTLAAEIGFFYASEAVEDTVGTAHMNSAMRERHLAKLGWTYGYGIFLGTDGELHSGVERMGPIEDFKEES